MPYPISGTVQVTVLPAMAHGGPSKTCPDVTSTAPVIVSVTVTVCWTDGRDCSLALTLITNMTGRPTSTGLGLLLSLLVETPKDSKARSCAGVSLNAWV